ncbi:nitrilase-related carbon-nitrogen hydrolase [Curtobacterium sp. MCLR17_007]|uniref:nitrilase-related carbon-nitrogen hydrolase n=1 Tax=Curtobacterium sp. MCLR17_007 TaxID=2175648 RepID=UPI000DA992D1|nr:nitrilase-related carbon-nitrogen hydrolase [Curtobacterium sp. MCLR17_007]WIB59770.1 nitrilase-related carbon-nitrogen hydrolase [Curtobacterium sp. MCLR17_007]
MTRVAAVQLAPQVGDLDANRATIAEALAAVPDDVDVVVLPELATSGYVFRDAAEARSSAVTATDATVSGWATTASRLSGGAGGVVVGGFAELGDDGAVYNSAALVDPTGVVGVYRKVHLWDGEKACFTPGSDGPLVVDTRHGRIGVSICFDVEFPEWTRMAALDGAELLAVPTNWPWVDRPEGERAPEVQIAMAAARVNRMAMACADRCGTERGVDWNEGTSIIDHDGWVRAATGPGAGMVVADLDLAAARDKTLTPRADLLGDRRPDLYGPLSAR